MNMIAPFTFCHFKRTRSLVATFPTPDKNFFHRCKITTPPTCSPSKTDPSTTSSTTPTHTRNLNIMTTKSCAKCNTSSTGTHPLKLCGNCKIVSYCNQACQKADWKAHKSICRQSGAKKAKDQAELEEAANNIATLEDSLLADGQLELGETISIPHDSYVFKNMRPTFKLPNGYQRMIAFPPQWLASISHLPAGEQEKARTNWANQMEAAMEAGQASMTMEAREAQRLEAVEVGKVQERFLANLAAKKAAKDAESK